MNSISNFQKLIHLDLPKAKVTPQSAPIELIEWSLSKFDHEATVVTTAFGMEGCALIDMFSRLTSKLTVAYIDTGFFFPETKKLIEQMEQRYDKLHFEKWESPISIAHQQHSYGDALWENNPNLCCHVRKVVPMKINIQSFQLWTTGVRKTQTEQRANTSVLSWDWTYEILKFCPMANWTRDDVWDYIQKHDVPFNQLHLQEFPSIGCTHCTRSVPGSSPTDESRQGRWQGTEKTECGLHYSI